MGDGSRSGGCGGCGGGGGGWILRRMCCSLCQIFLVDESNPTREHYVH